MPGRDVVGGVQSIGGTSIGTSHRYLADMADQRATSRRHVVLTTARLPWLVLGCHTLVCLTFLVARQPEPKGTWFNQLDAVRAQGSGHFLTSSAAPMIYLAERPLSGWSEWHGGERTWVKVVEVLNFIPLAAAWFVDLVVSIGGVLPVRPRSWVVAGWFFALSCGQWFGLGVALRRIC